LISIKNKPSIHDGFIYLHEGHYILNQPQKKVCHLHFLSEYSMILLSQFKNKNRVIAIGFLRKKSESWGKNRWKITKKTLNSDENLKN
jgi:hypothetical protein